ncbi:MAG TPA: alkaline phosphatase family protein [Phycisphaerae bacterium]|nr:alkaline phosphatase family protein [Phycisphaerae bacterium]HRW51976.1 alkaline phosphatase family protein [Phycisphaerae bacterium]
MLRILIALFVLMSSPGCSDCETSSCADRESTSCCESPQPVASGDTKVLNGANESAGPANDQMTFVPRARANVESTAAAGAAETRVMIVSFDGLRPDAINADNAPTLQALIDGGAYQPAGLAEIPAATLPNHASMITGLSIISHGVFVNVTIDGRIVHQTIFDVARAHGVSSGFFANKTKLGYLCAEGDADVRVITGDVDDIANECANAIRERDLRLIFLHFGEPDGAGHSQGWMTAPYLTQVKRVDTAFSRVLDALAERNLRDETLLILTADHGGHDRTHGFPIPQDQHVPFILNGPGIASGRTLTSITRPMDAAATALTRLDLPTTSARDGRDVAEAREDFTPDDNGSDDPAMALGALCGPFPWLFLTLTLTLVGARRVYRRPA